MLCWGCSGPLDALGWSCSDPGAVHAHLGSPVTVCARSLTPAPALYLPGHCPCHRMSSSMQIQEVEVAKPGRFLCLDGELGRVGFSQAQEDANREPEVNGGRQWKPQDGARFLGARGGAGQRKCMHRAGEAQGSQRTRMKLPDAGPAAQQPAAEIPGRTPAPRVPARPVHTPFRVPAFLPHVSTFVCSV